MRVHGWEEIKNKEIAGRHSLRAKKIRLGGFEISNQQKKEDIACIIPQSTVSHAMNHLRLLFTIVVFLDVLTDK